MQLDPEAAGRRGALEDDDDDSKFRGQKQIATSLAHLDKKKALGIDETTIIRVNADWRENHRRVLEEALRQERGRAVEAEAEKSGDENAVVEARWGELLSKKYTTGAPRGDRRSEEALSGYT